jgi:signal transduction histidine kinase
VLTNLVVNATLHAFEGRTQRELHIEASQLTNAVSICVADNGNGMTSEAIAHVFEPFFTTRRDSGGSGLGLFSARRVVENVLGGSIDMHSVRGEGTKFQILLPTTGHLSAVQQHAIKK